MADEPRPRLGRGLAALIGEASNDVALGEVSGVRGQRRVAIEFVRPNPRNPRRNFAESDLEELAASIAERGVIQPVVVRQLPNLPDVFELIAGERRWRAAQRAGLTDIPVVVIEADDKLSLELAIVENVQRSDLNPIEEAMGYDQLMQDFSYTQNDLAKIIGKSRSHVANTLRLLKLPDSIQKLVNNGDLTAGHARALLAVADPEAVAQKIIENGLNVREAERIAQEEADQAADTAPARSRARAPKDADTRALEKVLEDVLGARVRISHNGDNGELRLRYSSLQQLDMICQRLRG
ncbi:chromosome partitioning protein ParB [Camelimonas fluminis]|uniref:ParB/RepB/Spo0J family partition protein n=1 Tax=Camelimonas fluminis TaxID=1576911 RepID=A0ABV7UL04_9HYPH|nr:ParB/RepB/Spo0J family partition protein [Camelimonas fluminis]GHE54770.1 chromosome partitioning protein ParB [Camelimonas fluminis]